MAIVAPKNAHLIRLGKYRGYVPDSWNDLPTAQLLRILAVLLVSGYDPGLRRADLVTHQRFEILAILLGIELAELQRHLEVEISAAEEDEREELMWQWNQVLQLITFPFERLDPDEEEGVATYRLSLTLTRCPYPQLKMPNGTNWYAPADGLANISMYEFSHVFTAMDAYTESKDAADLDKLLAIIYRPAKPPTRENLDSDFGGDRRQPLYGHDSLVRQRLRYWKRAPQLVKQLLWFWLSSCRQSIVTHPALAMLFERTEGGSPDPFGWTGTMLHLSSDSVVNLPGVATQNYQPALLQLAREKLQAQEILERYRIKGG